MNIYKLAILGRISSNFKKFQAPTFIAFNLAYQCLAMVKFVTLVSQSRVFFPFMLENWPLFCSNIHGPIYFHLGPKAKDIKFITQ